MQSLEIGLRLTQLDVQLPYFLLLSVDKLLEVFYCSHFARNGDPEKAEIATAQTYFAVQTHIQESQDALTEAERRLLLRNRVKDANRKLSSAAKDAGVRSAMFGVFHDSGYKGLYGGLGMQELKSLKSIPPREELLDCMGRTELAANEFRITQAEDQLRKKNIQGERSAIDTHYEVGAKVRKTISDIGGTMPEKLAAQPSIKKLAAKRARDMKKLQGESES